MSLEWSHSEEEVLIDFYAKHESLHNKHHADYNYNRKNKLLAELVKELNRQSAGKKFKVDNVSTHWNELRNMYNQHKRKVTKDELSGNKSAQIQPDWIWWRKMTYIFTGVTLPVNSIPSPTNIVSNFVHHRTDNVDLSPVKRGTRSKPLAQTSPKVTVTKIKRRTTMAPPLAKDLSPSPTKIRRRRSIHTLSHNNDVEGSPPISADDTETEFECEISVTPIAAKGRQKRVSALSNSNRQLSTTLTSTTLTAKPKRINNVLSNSIVDQQSVVSSVEEDHVEPINRKGRQRRTVNIQETETPMEVDTQSANDECTSTAMFVESRLRTYDELKRKRMIFKIHQLFYQEDA